jgi:hypothetical protein
MGRTPFLNCVVLFQEDGHVLPAFKRPSLRLVRTDLAA